MKDNNKYLCVLVKIIYKNFNQIKIEIIYLLYLDKKI